MVMATVPALPYGASVRATVTARLAQLSTPPDGLRRAGMPSRVDDQSVRVWLDSTVTLRGNDGAELPGVTVG